VPEEYPFGFLEHITTVNIRMENKETTYGNNKETNAPYYQPG